jgi:hypothetical protein
MKQSFALEASGRLFKLLAFHDPRMFTASFKTAHP